MKAKINSLSKTLDGKVLVTFETDCEPEELQDFRDKELTLTIKKATKGRSLDANALLWATIGEIAKALNTDKMSVYYKALRDYGKYTTVVLDPAAVPSFKEMYRDCEIVGETEDKVYMLCYFGSSTYDREEFSHLLDGVIQDAKEAGIHLKASTEIEELYRQWRK